MAIQNRGGQLGIYGTRLITPLPTISVTSANPDFQPFGDCCEPSWNWADHLALEALRPDSVAS